MNCPNCLDRLPEYVDGTLNAELHAQVHAHLTACPQCHLALQQKHALGLQLHHSMTKAAGSVTMSAAFRHRVLRAAREVPFDTALTRLSPWDALRSFRLWLAAATVVVAAMLSAHFRVPARGSFTLDVPFHVNGQLIVSHAVFNEAP